MCPLGPDIMGGLVLSLVNAAAASVTSSVLKADQMTFRCLCTNPHLRGTRGGGKE